MTSIRDIKEHVLNRIVTKDINSYPFYNLYVEDIFPIEFYQLLKDKMLYYKYNEDLQDRNWDNPNFMNKRFLLRNIDDDEIDKIRQVFGDEIKNALMKKFYYGSYLDEIVFNHDLQFVFTDGNRFQKIHTDIPAQFISVNFYIPEDELTEQERFYDNSKNQNGEQYPDKFKDVIQWKISKYRLIEYGLDDLEFLTKLIKEKSDCKVNTLNGRIDNE